VLLLQQRGGHIEQVQCVARMVHGSSQAINACTAIGASKTNQKSLLLVRQLNRRQDIGQQPAERRTITGSMRSGST
jgi:hypothetical protein